MARLEDFVSEKSGCNSNDTSCPAENKSLSWTFDGDGEKLRLAFEAWRIRYAHLFDPYLAVHTSDVEPLPHQISAVYQEMLPRQPLRYVLADDPGAGKTVMTGLFIRELIARGDLARCLIVCPGSLAEQWQDELWQKFHLSFTILTNEHFESAADGNAFRQMPFAIARLDKLARSDSIQEMLKTTEWDLVVCDEAHKMSATVWGGEVRMTRRFRLGKLLSGLTRHFLLLTATPHNGKEEDFQQFLSLVDEDRFGGMARTGSQRVNVSDVMRRLVKEELLTFEGKPLFPERRAVTVNYTLSADEAELYEAVTTYVQSEFNRADRLTKARRNTVGFALTVLQRRLASSPEAIYQSLHRRRERLQQRLEGEHNNVHPDSRQDLLLSLAEDFDEDDYAGGELEDMEERLADKASAASNLKELEAEIATLEHLETLADSVRTNGRDRKWEELSRLLLDDKCMYDEHENREKLIIFTEHKDTLNYLVDRTRTLLGNRHAVVSIHGGMPRAERRKTEDLFRQDPEVRVLVATDAAGEGINLQRAHLMVNYDLPWNPNRLEQRFGRIHRIGQTRICWLWNLVADQTREGSVFDCLFRKLNQEREALGGKVFDILGKVSFDNRPLRDLLVDAVRHGSDPEIRKQIVQSMDKAFDKQELERLLAERALTDDVMNVQTVRTIREDMERMNARRLQPYFIESFFKEAFRTLGGRMVPREEKRWKIVSVPTVLRQYEHVLPRYERVCFDRERRTADNGDPVADLLCPGHPLFNAVVDEICRQFAHLLCQGAVLVDEQCASSAMRLLFYIEDMVVDGVLEADGTPRIISKEIHFVEIDEQGVAIDAGHAPYLDYRPATEKETKAVLAHLQNLSWPGQDVEHMAEQHAATCIVPKHMERVCARRLAMIDRTEKAVRMRLKAAIRYWDSRAWELQQQENEGVRKGHVSSKMAERRAEELASRLDRRMAELEAERAISARPPTIVGGALVIPAKRLADIAGTHETDALACPDAQTRREVELAAMNAVMALERELGFVPRDVSAEKCGYDIESHALEEDAHLRFIEVKGRVTGAKTVTVTRNEILCALNRPDNYILAVVEVDGAKTHTVYLARPFINTPDFSAECTTFNLDILRQNASLLLEK